MLIVNELLFTHILWQVFKEEIEKPDQPGGPILESTDIKLIFGKLTPIYETHVKIRDELNDMLNNWREDHSVGNIFVKYVSL